MMLGFYVGRRVIEICIHKHIKWTDSQNKEIENMVLF